MDHAAALERLDRLLDGTLAAPAKSRMREALCPASTEWRRRAVTLGLEVAQHAARRTFTRVGE